jgi:hypothetical protein
MIRQLSRINFAMVAKGSMNRMIKATAGYLTLWLFVIVLSGLEGDLDISPWVVAFWLAIIAWWGYGSRLARAILLVGSLLTGVAVLALAPTKMQSGLSIAIAAACMLQVVVLMMWPKAGGE